MARRSPPDNERDDGSFSLELAVLFPVFLLLLLAIVQAALYFFARAIAISAAQDGAQQARLQGRQLSDGAEAATQFVAEQGGGVLVGATASTAGSSPTQVRVAVTGHALAIIPGVALTITQSATAPRELYTVAGATP